MKLGGWTVVLITIMMFLEFIGIGTTLGSTLEVIGIDINSQDGSLVKGDIRDSSIYTKIFGSGVGFLILAIGITVTVGFFTKSVPTEIITLPLVTGVLYLFASTGWLLTQSVSNMGSDWLVPIIAILFLPLTVWYVISMVEWFRGMT